MRVFLDTSVVLAACGRSTGASRAIFEFAPVNSWQLFTSRYVLNEVAPNLPKLPTAAMMDWPILAPHLVVTRDIWTMDRFDRPRFVQFEEKDGGNGRRSPMRERPGARSHAERRVRGHLGFSADVHYHHSHASRKPKASRHRETFQVDGGGVTSERPRASVIFRLRSGGHPHVMRRAGGKKVVKGTVLRPEQLLISAQSMRATHLSI